ncbi:MAG: biopolymer transporter ExbD [bacterium]
MKRRRHETRHDQLILTSLVDIALSLVIGFLVAMPLFFESGIFVSAPGVSRAGSDEEGSDIKANVYINAEGDILLNESPVTFEQLAEFLPKLLDRSVERRVIVSTDEAVRYEQVMQVLDLAKQSGAADLALLRKRRAQ